MVKRSNALSGSGLSDPLRPETTAAQALGHVDAKTGAIIPPIHPSTTYERDPDLGYSRGRVYSRADNPTYDIAADTISALEGGARTLLFSSGMAAATAVFLALQPGDHLIAPKVMYWALRSWLDKQGKRYGLDVDFVDTGDLAAVKGALKPGKTKLVWLETPANPLWSISDIAKIAKIAYDAGAKLAVDSTVATPVLSKPLSIGADLVMHSATKYLAGHSDVVAGSVTTAVTDEFWDRIRSVLIQNGAVIGPFEAWLLQRGIRTLFLRVARQSETALFLAKALADHPKVAEVLYPGLADFPGHKLAKKQMSGGFGGMLSVRIKGGREAAISVAANLKLWKRATSLGGVESLVEHRASIEGPGSPVPDDLLRLSVGLEASQDLLADFVQALDRL